MIPSDICLSLLAFLYSFHPCCCHWHYSVLIQGWVALPCTDAPLCLHFPVDGYPGWICCRGRKTRGFPGGLAGRESACQCRRHGFNPWMGEDPLEEGMANCSGVPAWRIPWILVGCSPWGHKVLDMTEVTENACKGIKKEEWVLNLFPFLRRKEIKQWAGVNIPISFFLLLTACNSECL